MVEEHFYSLLLGRSLFRHEEKTLKMDFARRVWLFFLLKLEQLNSGNDAGNLRVSHVSISVYGSNIHTVFIRVGKKRKEKQILQVIFLSRFSAIPTTKIVIKIKHV